MIQTKNYILLSFSIIFLALNSYGQINTVLLNEQFIDNSKFWDTHDEPESILKLTEGKYYMKGNMLGRAITSTIEAPINKAKDFKISAELTKINGIDDNGFGLIWGSKDENNEYEFVISGNGQFKVIEWRNGIKKDLVAWAFYSNIQKWDGVTNRLRIERRGELIKFFINDHYVSVIPAVENFGNRIGFVINETMEVAFNYLSLEKIEYEEVANQQTDKVIIKSVEFNGTNELKYDESKVLKIILANTANVAINDLAIIISTSQNLNDIEYNKINMIESISAMDQTVISVLISADDEVETINRSFSIMLMDGKNNMLDSENIELKTVGHGIYQTDNRYNTPHNNKYESNNNSSYTPNSQHKSPNNKSSDGCAKGCSYLTLGALIAGLIIAIL
jgi:hypothetical protein